MRATIDNHPTHLLRDFPPIPNGLDQLDEDLPFVTGPWVCHPTRILPGCLLFALDLVKPHFDVLGLHPGSPSGSPIS
jgi:hypothetical protein